MILKLLFLASYYILYSKSVGGYVLFAANIDDFRNMANKIISGQLADQLAVMAKKSNMNYRHDKDIISDDGTETSKDESSDDNSESSSSMSVLGKANESSKKRFAIKAKVQDLDLDELVKRVKEKLEKSYKIVKGDQYEEDVSFATSKEKKIEDYYYKDDINADLNNDEEQKTYLKYTAVPEYLNLQSNAEYTKETPEYFENDANTTNYETLKEVVVYNDKVANKKNLKLHSNLNVQEVPQYYEKNTNHLIKQVTERTIKNNNKLNAIKTTDVAVYYENNVKSNEDIDMAQNEDIFKGVDMLNTKDSYEDYVIPKPDSDSDSTEVVTQKTVKYLVNKQTFVPDKNKNKVNSRPKAIADQIIRKEKKLKTKNEVIKPPTNKILSIAPNLDEIKAKTGSMWYKDPNIENYDDSNKKIADEENNPTTKRLGTMIPTLVHYKFSSPNYFAKLPVVAEKYKFDEPIPERDREPEKIIHIGNPPAKINMKVTI